MSSQKPRIYCSNCGGFVPASRLNWNELTHERYWGGGDDLEMGPHHWQGTPEIPYFRRVRRCSECRELLYTAELDEDLVDQLSRLRETVRNLRAQLARVAEATSAAQELLD